jgi:hypothetical protein
VYLKDNISIFMSDNVTSVSVLQLDTVCRVLLDRQWTVGELVNATLRFAQTTLDDPSPPQPNHTLFDELIGTEKPPVAILLETSL